jgi:hypothetical protein
MKKYNGVECWDVIHKEMAEKLKSEGMEHVGLSLRDLHRNNADVLLNAGLRIVSIWESGAEYAGYFSEEKGFADGKDAYRTAEYIGQPEGSAIYFPVHFEAQSCHMSAILSYFLGVRDGLGKKYRDGFGKKYQVGVYGSNNVLRMLHGINVVDCYWQSSGWLHENTVGFMDNVRPGDYQIIEGIPLKYYYFSGGAGSWI